MRGVVYVAYGDKANRCAARSIAALKDDLPVLVISDARIEGQKTCVFPQRDRGARWAKLNIDVLSPFEQTLYLDADTIPYQEVSAGFQLLDDGWEFVIAPSPNQERDWLWHVEEEERIATEQEVGRMVQLQGGVWFMRKTPAVHRMFSRWREEWERWQGQDQAALMRALQKEPVRLWLLGPAWNGGVVVGHRFGEARE